MSAKEIWGNTVGMGLPKPNLMQEDPKKGDYVKGKEEFARQHILMPSSAKVGQYIMVSAVDETGKVTATEAVDAPKGEVLTDAEGVAF